MKNWNQQEVEVATSKGGVIALANPYDNLVKTGVAPWPPSEIVQKLYQSRQARAFVENQKEKSVEHLGYYSDLQSIHSEDAITWSVFGTAAHSSNAIRNRFISDFIQNIGAKSKQIRFSEIFLWRRIPHPATFADHPEMNAYEVTDEAVKRINSNEFSLMIINLANCDMVGHTGNYEAAMKAVEVVDECIGSLTEAILSKGKIALITADHGNADEMIDYKTGIPKTSHTKNPVEFIYVDDYLCV